MNVRERQTAQERARQGDDAALGPLLESFRPYMRVIVHVLRTLKVPKIAATGNQESLKRLYREAQAAAHLRHVNICPVYDVCQIDGTHYLTMAFIDGRSLKDSIRPNPGAPGLLPAQAAAVVRKLALGLAEVHKHGVVHRDLKPSKIMIDRNREPVIMDFSLAFRSAPTGTRLTHEGMLMGTPAYMSPEQATGAMQTIGPPTVIYALGVILYEVLTGQLPFEGPIAKVLGDIMYRQPDLPSKHRPDLDPKLESICIQAMAKNIGDRFASMADFAAALAKWLRDWTQTRTLPESAPDALAAAIVPPDGAPGLASIGGVHRRSAKTSGGVHPRRLLISAAIALLVLFGGGLAAYQLVFSTKDGTLIVEVDGDADVRFQKGELRIHDADGKLKYTLKPSEKNKTLPPGKYLIEVAGVDGLKLDSDKFEITQNGKAKVRVTVGPAAIAAKKRPPTPPGDPDRRADSDRQAAEWVLSIGGTVRVDDAPSNDIKAASELPNVPFRLRHVLLSGNNQEIDAGLACLKDCKNLMALDLGETQVSDAGLAHFKDFKTMTHINLSSTKVTDAGLTHFRGCNELQTLELQNTKAGDTGLANFANCKKLSWLGLSATQVTDAGLAHFKDCKELTHLHLQKAPVSNAGMIHFKDCKKFKSIGLSGPKVTEIGLAIFRDIDRGSLQELMLLDMELSEEAIAHFAGPNLRRLELQGSSLSDTTLAPLKSCNRLATVNLFGAHIGDAGVAQLTNRKNLSVIYLNKTHVTAAGIQALSKALPQCKIEWDDGVIEPAIAADPDRRAAEYVLSIGGTVRVNDQRNDIKAAAELPAEPFRLRHVSLTGNKRVTDAALACFSHCRRVQALELGGTPVSDAGLAHFQHCVMLTHLVLSGTQVTDAGLAYFKDCKKLVAIKLDNTKVGDTGMANFKDCKSLIVISLMGTQVTDEGLANFRESKEISQLYSNRARVTNAGLALFKDCSKLLSLGVSGPKITDNGPAIFKDCDQSNLIELTLSDTNVTDAGLAHIRDYSKLLWLDLSGSKVTDAELGRFKDSKRLTNLFLENMWVTDSALSHFRDCKKLVLVYLDGTPITDAGLANFKDCKDLMLIKLSDTQVTDVGLAQFRDCTKLDEMHLYRIKVTAAGIEAARRNSPQCRVWWDGGFMPPKPIADTERRNADEAARKQN